MSGHDPDDLEPLARGLRRALRPGTADETVVPGFSVLEVLGAGGQGTVHQAVQLSTGRRVALKVLRKGRMATVLERKRFLREIRLAASLEHPGLVTVYEAGETTEETPYLAMELVRGEPWDVWSDRVRSGEGDGNDARVLRTFAELCDAVAHAHERGVLHRDLKPSNVVVEEGDRPRVLDLGLAYSLDVDDHTDFESRTSDFLGSLPWMPPERIKGEGDPAPASDVHSLGLLLHRALTGRHAYSIGSSITDIVNGVTSLPDSLDGPLCADAKLDRSCLAVLSKALDERPESRHPDAAALATEVRELLSGRTFEPRRRSRKRMPALVALLAVAAIAAVALMSRRGSTEGRARESALRAIELVQDDGLSAWKAMFGSPSTIDATGEWTVPGPQSTALNHWRLAATHVYEKYPAERADELGLSRNWIIMLGSRDGRLWLLTDAERTQELFVSEPAGLRRLPIPGGPHRGGGMTRDGRWCVFARPDAPELVVFRVTEDFELEPGPVLPAEAFLRSAESKPWIAVRAADQRTLQVLDLEKETVRFEIDCEDYATQIAFARDDRQLWVRQLSGRWSWVDIDDPNPRLVEVPEAKGAPQILPLPDNQLYMRHGVDHFVVDLETGGRRLLSAGNVAGSAVLVQGAEITLPVYHGVQRFRAARFSPELVDWVGVQPWTTPDLISIDGLPATHGLGLLRRSGEVIVLDPSARGIPEVLSAGIRDDTFHEVSSTDRGWMACRGGQLFLFNEAGERVIDVTGPLETIYGFEYDGVGTVYFTTEAGRVGAVDVDAPGSVQWMYEHTSFGSVVAVSPDGRWLAAADSGGEVAFLSLHDTSPARVRMAAEDQGDRVPDLAWGADSRWVLTGRRHSGRQFWTGPEDEGFHAPSSDLGEARAIVFNDASNEWITGHESGSLAYWTAASEAPRERLEVAPGQSIWGLDLSPNGRFLAVGAGREVSVWDWKAERRLFSSGAHDGLVFAVAFHRELPQLASAAEHGELFVWDFGRVDDLAQGRQGQ